ncbi:hypothetical protein [Streptomyces sp. NBRC 110028]|uniref:hypothetical protein n=1 Tax=Streptomyces sp. NBRC 110028 TaxID=1621260 RepID=UPI000A7145B7|nr:hypothetical protein [Streptomyces sp. NBRC 110028]
MALTTGLRPPLTRRRRRVTAAALALALLSGAVVWFAGSGDRALDEACGGALAADEVRAVLGDSGVEVTSSTEGTFGGDGGTSLAVRCEVTAEDRGRVDVTISGAPRPRAEYGTGDPYTAVPAHDTLPVPLGHGWSGLLATDNARQGDPGDGKATAAVLLDCVRGGRSLLTPSGPRSPAPPWTTPPPGPPSSAPPPPPRGGPTTAGTAAPGWAGRSAASACR